MTSDRSRLRAQIEEWREYAKNERANDWNNTQERTVWRAIHDHRAQVFEGCANRLEALLDAPASETPAQADVKELQARLSSLEALIQEWQPIETAPKDGTTVLVANIVDGKVWRVSEARFRQVGWFDNGGSGCHWRTHWAPMPPVSALLRATPEQPK